MHMLRRSLPKCFLLLQIFLGEYCYGQNSTEDSLFNNFRKNIQIQQGAHGCVKFDDETKESYYLLMATHSIEVLVKYTDDTNPAVRFEIFYGLVQKKADDAILKEILNKHIDDTAEITYCDFKINWKVSEYMQTVFRLRDDVTVPVDYKARLDKLRYKIRNGPRLVIPGFHHNTIAKDSLLKVDSLIFSNRGFKIISFVFCTQAATIKTSNIFTKQMKEVIRNLKPGAAIVLDEIKVEGPDKSRGNWPTVLLMIK